MTSIRPPVTSRSTRLGAMAVTIVVVFAAFSPFVVGVADAQETEPVVTEISSCQAITEPGVYRQTADLSSEGTCIGIVPVAGDVVYDGNGYSITGDGTGEGIYSGPLTDDAIIENVEISHFRSGVSIDDSSGTVSNSELTSNEIGIEAVFFGRIDVSDTTFVDNQIGIEYNQESSGTIVRNTFDDNGVALSFLESVPSDVRENTFVGNNIGVLLDAGAFGLSGLDIVDNRFVENGVGLELRSGIGGGLSENTISGNRIVDSTDAGIVFGPTDEFGTIADNEIYNNWLENDVNVRFDSAFSGGENAWSVPTSPGPNIVGGPSIGGNYYATPDGDGFSQTCTDTDEDGFCDTPLSLFANNVDALPLATFPQNEVSSCQAITEPGVYRQTADLSSEGTCISIGGPDPGTVVYDGNGYSITGDGTGVGIDVGPITDEATIENVDISNFQIGVAIFESSGSVSNSALTSNEYGILTEVVPGRVDVSDTAFVDNDVGIEYGMGTSGTAVGNTFESNDVGVSFLDAAPSDVGESTFVANDIGVLIRAGTFGSSGIDVVDSEFVENGVGLEFRSLGDIDITENTISGNRIVDSTDAGIVFGSATIADNEIYDNWFENDVNVRFDSAFSGGENAWNVPARDGPNIAGGPSIGGNSYATPAGDGFSQTCTDADEDGFCDTPFTLFANNVDALPLVIVPPTEVSSCQAITEPGVYRQTADLSSEGTCVSIGGPTVGEVVYDGNGYSITGDGTGVGIDVGPITDEATIENVDISNFRWGIAIFESSGSVSNSELTSNEYGLLTDVDSRADVSDTTFVDNEVGIEYGMDSSGTAVGNTFEDNDVGVSFLDAAPSDVGESTFVANDIGILIRAGTLGSSGIDVVDSEFVENGVGLELRSLGGIDVTENTISGNRIVDSTDVGILVGPSDGFGTIADNEIYDNWLENDVNVRFDSAFDGGVNMWNVPTSGGPNIVGGPSIGGNYYATPAGDGFSQTCTDADGDGFCDTPLSLFANNVDALPLVAPTQISSCQVISTPGQYVQTTDLTATGDCIVVTPGAGEVTYDGNGYSIAGDGTGAGVRIEASASVKNVDISEFHQGLYFIGYPGGSVLDSELRGNGVGVYVAELIDVRVSGTVIADNDVGIYYGPSAGGLVDENTIENNGVGVRYDDTFGIGDPVRDNTIVDNGVGVSLSQSDDIEIVSNTFETNGVGVFVSGATLGAGGNDVLDNDFDGNDIAIEFQPMDGGLFRNIVSGNTIVDSTDVGFLVGAPGEFSSFTDNEIYDNRFENHENVRFDPAFDGGANTWNLPANPGPNIVGGPSIGGNYYATPDGDGFSQTCTDADEDGFCDTPNTLFVHNVDELPLVRPAPSEGISFPPGFFVDSDCTGVVTVGSLRVTFEAGFDGGEPTLSMVGFDVGRIDLEELARLIDAVTLTNLELSCTVAPADGGAQTSFDFDLSTYEGRDVAVCFEQADGTVTCFQGPVDEDGWHPDNLDRAVPFARSVFGGNTLADATFFPDGLPADADQSMADADATN